MHLVLTLHSHLPYVLNHGRWPHGSDWLCEAALDTYLPLLESLRALEVDRVSAPITLGITPVLANQLASPRFQDEMDAFFRQRLQACDEAPASLEETGDRKLIPLVEFWRSRFETLQGLFRDLDGDLVGAFRSMEQAGRLEIMSSAATHGFLPLLGRDESIRLQLDVGAAEHKRFFGQDPRGCWAPECAYRPDGDWDPIPGTSRPRYRDGVEAFLAEAGYRYFFIDTHMAQAGQALGATSGVPHGAERFDIDFESQPTAGASEATRSAYRTFLVGDDSPGRGLAAFVREPFASMQVWSRHHGYPGDEWYLEFHKIRWPGGLKFWRVTGPDVDLGGKAPFEPTKAKFRASDHATHFAGFLGHTQRRNNVGPSGVAMIPFDTELFGHWWFEGVAFLRELFRRLPYRHGVIPVTASQHLDSFPPEILIRPVQGSWGANGDFSMWLNDGTRWTWERLWPLEDSFWDLAPGAVINEKVRPILAQAARQLLLAQSSDWQFMISTGAVPDYARERFALHCDDTDRLLEALDPLASPERVAEGLALAKELEERDDVFPNILESIERVLKRV